MDGIGNSEPPTQADRRPLGHVPEEQAAADHQAHQGRGQKRSRRWPRGAGTTPSVPEWQELVADLAAVNLREPSTARRPKVELRSVFFIRVAFMDYTGCCCLVLTCSI